MRRARRPLSDDERSDAWLLASVVMLALCAVVLVAFVAFLAWAWWP